MSPESARSNAVTTEHINFAQAVAIRYRSLHPRLDQDDSISLANDAVMQVFCGDAMPSDNDIASAVENALRSELRRVSKRRKRETAIEADEFGEPLFSIRDLRTARSLNPRTCNQADHAPLNRGFVAALGEVCESAVRQTQETHPLHAEYVGSAGVSRDLVSQSLADRKLRAELFQRNEERMARRRAA